MHAYVCLCVCARMLVWMLLRLFVSYGHPSKGISAPRVWVSVIFTTPDTQRNNFRL